MDSVTQLLLGATVAAACVPAAQRRRALLYGAALGTLPDLDVLVRYADPVSNMTMHRSYTHSLLLLPWLALALWWLARRLDGRVAEHPRRWLLAFMLALVTHPLLDAFTIYGTQLWWPIDPTPVGLGSIFIIDPLFTLPLLLAVLWVVLRGRLATVGSTVLPTALGLSSAYLLWSAVAQQYVLTQARNDPLRPRHPEAMLMATPAPLNTLLWRVLQRQPGSYDEAYMSLLADAAPSPWLRHPSSDDQGAKIDAHPPYQRMVWFTHGWYGLRELDDQLVLSDLRMGSEPLYVFSFALAQRDDKGWSPIPAQQLAVDRPTASMLSWLSERLLNPGDCLPSADQMLAAQAPVTTPAPASGQCLRALAE